MEEQLERAVAAAAAAVASVPADAAAVSVDVHLQPVDRPGTEGWEALVVYGLVHPLKEYQQKVCCHCGLL